MAADRPKFVKALRDVQATKETFDFSDAGKFLSQLLQVCFARVQPAAAALNVVELSKWAGAASAIEGSTSWAGADVGFLEAGKANGLQGIIDYLDRPIVEYPASVLQQLGQSWNAEYEDPHDVLGYVCETLDGYVQQWEPESKYLAAWTSVIQSSGWGKSRTICELWKKGVYVIYLSFMPHERMGIPAGTPAARAISVNLDEVSERAFASWFVAFLGILRDFILKDLSAEDPVAKAQSWMKYQEAHADYIKATVTIRQKDLFTETQQLGPGSVFEPGHEWSDMPLKTWFQGKIGEFMSLEGMGRMLRDSNKLRILFCLDEAGSLFRSSISSFLAFRRVFSIVSFDTGLFGVVMDTTAHLGLLQPQKSFDPSAKGTKQETRVFPPLNLVGVSRLDTSQLFMLRKGCLERPSLEATAELFKLGRPLWSSCLVGKTTEASFGDFRLYACQKLLGGLTLGQVHEDPKLITQAMAMALLGITAGLEVAAWSTLAVEMVASHMRTAVEISDDRDRIFSADAMEPVLGEAAAVILADDGTLVRVLQLAVTVCKQALVVEGPRGELVGRLLLVMAMHSCYKGRPIRISYNVYSYSVKLGEFLTKLCGRKVKAEGLVCFNRFIVLNRQVTRADLLMCFLCGYAIQPRRNQEAFDDLIPYLAPGPEGTYELREDRMRAIPVQIKNRDSYTKNTTRLRQYAEFFYYVSEDEFDGTFICDHVPDLSKECDRALDVIRDQLEDTHAHLDDNDALISDHAQMEVDLPADQHDEQMEVDQPVAPPTLEYLQGTDQDDQEAAVEVNGPLALYFHLRGRKIAACFEDLGNVLVLHGLRPYKFLGDDVRCLLEGLRVAFHKLPQTGKADLLRRLVPHYYTPKLEIVTEAQLKLLSVIQLKSLCTARDIKMSSNSRKAKYVAALMKYVTCGICKRGFKKGEWMSCDGCEGWYHFSCVDIKGWKTNFEEHWKCNNCKYKLKL